MSLDEGTLKIRRATPEDSEKLGSFFTSIPTHGSIEVKMQRDGHFTSFYERVGAPSETYILEDGSEIQGMASFLFQEFSFEKRNLRLAQACDLRISKNRKAILGWSKFFEPLLSQIREEKNIDGFMTSINQTESQAMNAFIRPKLRRSHQPVYNLARSFNTVSIHGFYPWSRRPHKDIVVKSFEPQDKPKLLEFLKSKINEFDFVPSTLKADINEYIQNSILYSWSQFIIAYNSNNEIIGCTQLISSSLLQDYLPQDYDSQAHNFRQFLKVARWLGFGRTLTRPFSRTQKQEALHFRLMHFLIAPHAEILLSLIHHAYRTSRQHEFIVYSYEKEDFAKRPPIGSVFAEIPYGLYGIETSNREVVPELTFLNNRPTWLDFKWF